MLMNAAKEVEMLSIIISMMIINNFRKRLKGKNTAKKV